jgi:ABC-type branched-chain amino acid transport system, permease component
MKKGMKFNVKSLITIVLTILLYAIIYIMIDNDLLSRHFKGLLVSVGVNIILAVSLNLTVGFLGNLTLGHAGFMSVGAYAGCLFTVKMNLPYFIEFPIALIIGGIVAAIFGVIIGVPALRLRGDYLAIVTLAFGEIIRSIFNNLSLIGGAGGLKNISKYTDFTWVYLMIIITILVIANLVKSRHGRAICSIRDNIIASESLGIDVVYHKLLAFVVAAFFAGVAGVLYGHYVGILKPTTFDFNKSIEILVIVVLGGMGSLRGSVISAIIITVLPEVLRSLSDYRMLIYSLVLIAMMLLNASPSFQNFKENVKSGIDAIKIKIAKLFGRSRSEEA